jgi:hypothetical protein
MLESKIDDLKEHAARHSYKLYRRSGGKGIHFTAMKRDGNNQH